MNTKIFLACFILIASLTFSEASFDYLLFVQEVPGGVCKNKTCNKEFGTIDQSHMNMHGMWPNYFNGSYPSYCYTAPAYSDSLIDKTVLTELDNTYIGLYSNKTSFRDHEWEKHGTCYIQGLNQNIDANMTKFFKDTMDTQKKLDLDSVIYQKTTFNKDDLTEKLKAKIGGKSMFFDCDQIGHLINVYTCLDKQLNPIDCPSTVKGTGKTCKESVYVVPTPKDMTKNGTTPSKTFDYLLFVMEVPGWACLSHNCNSKYGTLEANSLNMHGMWPNFLDGSYPTNCYKAESYSDSKIAPSTLQELSNNWIGVFSDATSFRNHEWTKHGTCYIQGVNGTTNAIDQDMNRYFADTMSSKINFGLDKIVYSKTSWNYSDLYNALHAVVGKVYQFDCDSSNHLANIRICLDKKRQPMDCPSTLHNSKKCKTGTPITILPVPDSILRTTETTSKNLRKEKLE